MRPYAAVLLLLLVSAPAAAQDAYGTPFTAGITDAASLKAAVDARIARARQLLQGMLAVTGTRTPANTLAPYDELMAELDTASTQARVLAQLHPDDALRRAGEELNRAATSVSAEIGLRTEVYAALQAIDLRRADAETKYYVERERRDFVLAGVDRPAATRERLQQLRVELTGAMDEWARNIREKGTRVVVQSAADLEGLPADFIARHKPNADGTIVLAGDIDARPVLTYARSDDLRRRMLVAQYTVAVPDNMAVLNRMLRTRADIASLLGYPNWASYDMASRMTGTTKAASEFIDRVVAASGAQAAREHAQLLARKRQDVPGSSLNWWDRAYYSELVRRSSYDFDSQSVRPYFPFDRVLQGALDVTATVFGVTYRQVMDVPVWHPSVRVYEMLDGGRRVGRVYLDLHPRPGKRATGASVSTVRYGQQDRVLPETVLSASLPGGEPGDPGLMTHDDVVTLFHEFGHVIHRLSGGHRQWQRLSTSNMERDFTEAPSQMLEEWVFDPKTLATFAKHYQTGEPIPERLVRQMRRAAQFGQATSVRQQMVYARGALTFHERAPQSFEPTALWKEIHERYVSVPFVDGTHMFAAFPHLGNPGYASAYHTYMWSLVIAKDLFSQFEGKDLMTPGIARRYREAILMAGSSKPAAQLVEDFLGRTFSFDAWQRWLSAN